MARGVRVSLDTKIEKAQAKVNRAQEVLDKAKAELKALEDKKNNEKRDSVVDMIMNSDMSLEEIEELLAPSKKD